MKLKKVLSLGLMAVTAFSMLAATGCGSSSADDEHTFSWWIFSTDGMGTYYENYEDNPMVQWLNQQYWDSSTGGLGTEENGTNIQFTFQVPITGSESDNFNTMLSTGEYTDIIDLSQASDTPETLASEGILMDITEYVEKWCPNYVAILDANPEQKALVTYLDDEGKTHYYSLAGIKDGNDVPWGGYVYRRDWVVKYCEPTQYVWDWDSAYVQQNGHPAVTPLEDAIASGNLEGWKANELYGTQFTSSEGEDPNEDYTDNVIFPSGMTDPYTISDWEWMFEGFAEALAERGLTDNTDAYCTTLYYPGYLQTGELISSFGGGSPVWSKDADQNVTFNGTSENFRTYLEAMNTWYNNGWLDTRFETRASDIFFRINENGTAQGMVGLWYSGQGNLGTTIRVTCTDPSDQEDAYVMACAVPVNDVYGTDAQKFNTPDSFYQGSRIASSIGITTAAEDKDLESLFTMFNWLYTEEGAMTRTLGLSAEQLEETPVENDLYAENGMDGAYTITEGAGKDGKRLIALNYEDGADITNALKGTRLGVGLEMTGAGPGLDYTLDKGKSAVSDAAQVQWTKYTNTAGLLDYGGQFTEEESNTFSTINTAVNDYMAQHVPPLIKEGLGGWDAYVSGMSDLGVDEMTQIYQRVMDDLFGK